MSEGDGFAPGASAQELADSLRASVVVRRGMMPAADGEDAARLRDLGDLEGVPPTAKPGAAAPVVRLLRRVLRAFLRPWLAAQTIFNRELARRFQGIATTTRDLDRRMPGLEQSLQHLEARLMELERMGRTPPRPSVALAAGDVASLERMFVHSRLPRPPARVLLVGSSADGVAPDLASFGFDVAKAAALPVNTSSPFDVVVCLEASQGDSHTGPARETIVAATAALAPSGRLLVSLQPASGGAPAPTNAAPQALAALVAPLAIAEALLLPAVWLIDARDPDASHR